jgi:hypothetical protein
MNCFADVPDQTTKGFKRVSTRRIASAIVRDGARQANGRDEKKQGHCFGATHLQIGRETDDYAMFGFGRDKLVTASWPSGFVAV